jgi:pyruvate/2-oxoglutarate dehydrogenase complex dihydrolipoamide dehydrogenase (E3) component
MSKYQYDLIVIGGGSGGLVAARVAAALGARTGLIDKERLGGDCLHYGCVPSKSLIHAAKIAQTARESAVLTVSGEEVPLQIDMAKVTKRIEGIIERVGEAEQVYVTDVDVKFGHAEFQSAHELTLDGQTLTAQSFIIATGSRPKVPQLEGLQEVGYLTNEDVFDLMNLPPSLVIVGGGPIGVEMAQAFARLGSQVTILQGPDRILPKEEPEVSQAVAEALLRDGVKIVAGARLNRVRKEDGQKVVVAKRGYEEIELKADEIILALGRTPNTAGLNLEAAGIKYDAKGIKTNELLQTEAENIYAIGDVIGGYLFTHVAAYQGGVAVRNALVPIGRKKVDYRVVPWVTFTDPEAARVGMTEEEAMKQFGKVRVLRFPWKEIDRAQAEGETDGFIKLILNEKGEEIYGAHLVGARSGEMLAEVALAMQHKLGISGILATIHAYPTMATGLQNAAFEAYLESSALSSSKKILRPILSFRG